MDVWKAYSMALYPTEVPPSHIGFSRGFHWWKKSPMEPAEPYKEGGALSLWGSAAVSLGLLHLAYTGQQRRPTGTADAHREMISAVSWSVLPLSLHQAVEESHGDT